MNERESGLGHFAGLDAVSANAQPLVRAFHYCAHWTQVHIPAPAADIVSVADLVSKLRSFAADFTNLCHFG
jgi:hypothetical protein